MIINETLIGSVSDEMLEGVLQQLPGVIENLELTAKFHETEKKLTLNMKAQKELMIFLIKAELDRRKNAK